MEENLFLTYAPGGPPTTIDEAHKLIVDILCIEHGHETNAFSMIEFCLLYLIVDLQHYESGLLLCQAWENLLLENECSENTIWRLRVSSCRNTIFGALDRSQDKKVELRKMIFHAKILLQSQNSSLEEKVGAATILGNAATEENYFQVQERQELLEEAMKIMESLTIEQRKTQIDAVRRITSNYVQFHLNTHGPSPRLEKLLRKNFVKNEEILGFDEPLTIDSACDLVSYLEYTHQFDDAIDLARRILTECDHLDITVPLRLNLSLILSLWGNENFGEAQKICEKSLKLAKKAKVPLCVKSLKNYLKRIRKKKRMPRKKAKEASHVVSKKEYRKMRNFSENRACAHCGKHDIQLLNCSRCEGVWYCSKAHQKADWKTHKKLCKKQ